MNQNRERARQRQTSVRGRTLIGASLLAVVLVACGTTTVGGSIEGSWQLESGSWYGNSIPVIDGLRT